jgi:hypothetical protein
MNDDQLRRLLSDAVSDIEPEDRIEQLRASVHPSPKVVPMSRPRSWYAGAGIVATAAVIGVIAYLTSVVGDKSTTIGPAGTGGTSLPTVIATDTAAPQASRHTGKPPFATLGVYFLGQGPHGDVLYRQGTPVASDAERLDGAVASLMTDPFDPDYRMGWTPGWLLSSELRHGVIDVDLGNAPAKRPAHMSARTAYEVVQSAVYTLQAAAGTHASVQFLRSGRPAASVLGVPTGQPVEPGAVSDVLSRMNIATPPVDGMLDDAGRLVVTGTSNGPQGTVVIRLVRRTGTGEKTVLTRQTTASGTGDPERLYPWRIVLSTSSLTPGRYTIVASNVGASAPGQGGGHVASDTRQITLR